MNYTLTELKEICAHFLKNNHPTFFYLESVYSFRLAKGKSLSVERDLQELDYLILFSKSRQLKVRRFNDTYQVVSIHPEEDGLPLVSIGEKTIYLNENYTGRWKQMKIDKLFSKETGILEHWKEVM